MYPFVWLTRLGKCTVWREPLFEMELACVLENKKQVKPEFILPQLWG